MLEPLDIYCILFLTDTGATGGYSPTNEGQDSDNSSLDDDDDIDSDDERFKSDHLEEVVTEIAVTGSVMFRLHV